MANPIFNQFKNNNLNNFQSQFFGNGNQNNLFSMMGKFNEFKSQFQGDPQQKVEELLNSGKMTREQYEMFSNMAKKFQGMFGMGRGKDQ